MLVEYNSRNRGFKNVCRIFFLLSFVLCLTKVMIYSKIGQKKKKNLTLPHGEAWEALFYEMSS